MRMSRVVLFLALAACRKGPSPASPDASASAGAQGGASASSDAAISAPPRCTLSPAAAEIAGDGPTEIGEGVVTPTQIAVGLTHTSGSGKNAAIALLAAGSPLAAPRLVDLGPAFGDAPPPKPIARGDELYAAAYGRITTGTSPSRDLVVSKIADGKATPLFTLPRRLNESLSFDAALGEKGGLIAWDEDLAAPVRGIVRIAAFPSDNPKPRTVSPESSDAESPRVAPRPGGYWLLWIARTPEPAQDGGGHELEAPGEDRAYAWLELLALDESGAPSGAVQRLTPAKQHVEAFDLAVRNAGADLDVLARDDDEPRDGAGGRLVLYAIHDQAVTSRVLVPDGVGRGIPDLLSPWVVFPDTADRLRLLPAATGPAPAPSSPEPTLDGARPLAVTPAGLLAAFPADPKHLFRLLSCVL